VHAVRRVAPRRLATFGALAASAILAGCADGSIGHVDGTAAVGGAQGPDTGDWPYDMPDLGEPLRPPEGAGGAPGNRPTRDGTVSSGPSGSDDEEGDGGAGAAPDDPAGGGGADGDPPSGAGGRPDGPDPIPAPPVVCGPIINGLSTVTVDGTLRAFTVQMPADTSRMAVLFLWHGYLQIPDQFASTIVYDVPLGQWVRFDPNAFPMPLMIVTPWDLKIIPPWGLDWEIVSGSVDVRFFDAMMECMRRQFSIDESRIYSFGFSAGAVFSNLLSAIYPNRFAATISESGAWFNDQAQWADVLIPIIQWQWPAFDAADGGNVLLTHGGPNDFATVISLESAAQKAIPFLFNHGRTVTECAHTFGHTLDPDLTQSMYYEWMWAHQLGGSPLGGLPPSFPTLDRPVGATRCVFHPAP
jgi:polyhydroxybutyrate depolymerase